MLDEKDYDRMTLEEKSSLFTMLILPLVWFSIFIGSLVMIGKFYDAGLAWLIFLTLYSIHHFNVRSIMLRIWIAEKKGLQ
jgi:hypothetical protein